MIEREATVKICSDLLANLLGGTKVAKGRLVRVSPEGYLRGHADAAGRQLHDPPAHRLDRDHRDEARARGAADRGGALAREETTEDGSNPEGRDRRAGADGPGASPARARRRRA